VALGVDVAVGLGVDVAVALGVDGVVAGDCARHAGGNKLGRGAGGKALAITSRRMRKCQ
jgi:hypothetical protein